MEGASDTTFALGVGVVSGGVAGAVVYALVPFLPLLTAIVAALISGLSGYWIATKTGSLL